MAKINAFIASYTDILQKLDIPAGEGLPPKTVISRFLRIFQKIDDSRIQAMVDYPLEVLPSFFHSLMRNSSELQWKPQTPIGLKNNSYSPLFTRISVLFRPYLWYGSP